MSKKIKLTALGAAIILLIAAALTIIFFGGDGGAGTEKMLAEAEEYLEIRDYDNAIAIYNRIISDEPECAEAYAGLSEAYYAKGRTDKAFEILEKGAENTDYDEIILNKSEELFPENNLENNDYEIAEEIFSETEITETTVVPESEITELITEISSETMTGIPETSSATTTEVTTTTSEITTTTPPTTTTTVRTTTAAPVTTTKPVTTTTAATTAAVTTTTVKLKEYEAPDFTLMTLDDAYAWCSKHNIILKIADGENNSEEILSQSPAPGSIVTENSEIIVILN